MMFAGIYTPVALAGLVFPRLFLKASKAIQRHEHVEAMLGFGLAQSLFAALLTSLNAKSGYMSAMWAVASLLGTIILSNLVRLSC